MAKEIELSDVLNNDDITKRLINLASEKGLPAITLCLEYVQLRQWGYNLLILWEELKPTICKHIHMNKRRLIKLRLKNDYNTRFIADLTFIVLQKSTNQKPKTMISSKKMSQNLVFVGSGIPDSDKVINSPKRINSLFDFLGVPVL